MVVKLWEMATRRRNGDLQGNDPAPHEAIWRGSARRGALNG